MTKSYDIFGIRADKTEVKLSETPYPSRGWCFATATKWAIDIEVVGNPDRFVRLELRDKDNQSLIEYNNSNLLLVN